MTHLWEKGVFTKFPWLSLGYCTLKHDYPMTGNREILSTTVLNTFVCCRVFVKTTVFLVLRKYLFCLFNIHNFYFKNVSLLSSRFFLQIFIKLGYFKCTIYYVNLENIRKKPSQSIMMSRSTSSIIGLE